MHTVKKNVNKFLAFFACSTLAVSFFSLGASSAHAEEVNELAYLNAGQVMQALQSVVPEAIPQVIKNLEKGKIKRIATKQPVWIMETLTETIMYYQGQPSYAGQSANLLVDDLGLRFGMKAVQQGKGHKSGWISMTLGGASYKAYCKSHHPFVVCSLAMK